MRPRPRVFAAPRRRFALFQRILKTRQHGQSARSVFRALHFGRQAEGKSRAAGQYRPIIFDMFRGGTPLAVDAHPVAYLDEYAFRVLNDRVFDNDATGMASVVILKAPSPFCGLFPLSILLLRIIKRLFAPLAQDTGQARAGDKPLTSTITGQRQVGVRVFAISSDV